MRHFKQFTCDDLTEEDRLAITADRASDIRSGKLDENDICPNCHRDYSRANGVPEFCFWCSGGF